MQDSLCEKKYPPPYMKHSVNKARRQTKVLKQIIEVLTDIFQHLFRNLRSHYLVIISFRILCSDMMDTILTLVAKDPNNLCGTRVHMVDIEVHPQPDTHPYILQM